AVPSPMMDLALFRNKVFSAGVLSNLLASTSRGAVGLVLVFYFQGALGLDALTAGLLLIPFSLAFVSVGPLSGYLSDKYGPRLFTTGGLIVSGVSYLWFAVLPYQVPYTTLVLPMILAGIGGGLFIAPNVASIMNSVPIVRRGVAAGMSATLFNVGFLVSLGLAFAIMASRMPLPVMQAILAGLPTPQGPPARGAEGHGRPPPGLRPRDVGRGPTDRNRDGMGHPCESRRGGPRTRPSPPRGAHDAFARVRRGERRDRSRRTDHGGQRDSSGPRAEGRQSHRCDPRADDCPPHARLSRFAQRTDRAGPTATLLPFDLLDLAA